MAEKVSEPENVHGLTMTSAPFRFGLVPVTTCNQSQQQTAPAKHRHLADRMRVLHDPEIMSAFYCFPSNSTFIHSCLEIKTNGIFSSLFLLYTTAIVLFECVSGNSGMRGMMPQVELLILIRTIMSLKARVDLITGD